MESAASQDYWDGVWDASASDYVEDRILFKDLFDRYLKPGGTCFEVGCYPGNFLVYLSKRFGYTVSGIDATPHVRDRMPAHLRRHGVPVGKLYYGDFFSFRPEETYDVVCSFGFIEHFPNFEKVIEHHLPLVKPGGTLVLSCPNFRNGQFLLRYLLDRENLRRHVLQAMDLGRWRRVLRRNGMRVIHQGYYRTAEFWSDSPGQSRLGRAGVRVAEALAGRLTGLVDYPNRFTSPYMVCFARKEG